MPTPSASSCSVLTPSVSSSSQGAQSPDWVPPATAAEGPSFNDAYGAAESAIRLHWGRSNTYAAMKSSYSAALRAANTSEHTAQLVGLLDRQKAFMKREYGSKGSYGQTLDYSSVHRDKAERENRDAMYSWISSQKRELTGEKPSSVASRMKGFARKTFRLPGGWSLGG